MRLVAQFSLPNFSSDEISVLVASSDSLLLLDLERILSSLGLRVHAEAEAEAFLRSLGNLKDGSILLLDTRLPGMAHGRLLASVQESGIHSRCAIALITEQGANQIPNQVANDAEEWIARLREGVIDDIVPRTADAAAWNIHLNTMRRGHRLYCELEQLRASVAVGIQHDNVTGAFNRETMLALLFRETDRVQRLNGSLCLILFEVDNADHWKSELSPPALDAVMHEICVRTTRMLRSYDLLGRMGRFQFLLALPGCSPVNAALLAERLQVEVFGQTFPATTRPAIRPIRLTACFGITPSRGRSPVVVLREAEQTLAVAQQSGPDTTLCSGESPSFHEDSLPSLYPHLYTSA